MLRFLKTVAIALALASLLPVATAFAATESPPADQWQADPPDHWRTMHPWPSRVPGTSRCLQQKTTPVCAVETQLYCAFAWSNPACDKLSKGDLAVALLTIIPQDMSSDYHYLKYRLPLVEIVTVGQADAIHATASQPGDYRVDMQVTYCHIKTKVCREDILPIFNFLLREVGGDWQVVEWDSLPLLKTGEMVPGTTLPKEQWMADPPDLWRKLTNSDDKPSTSRCIGQTTSPVCAVETLLACYRREVEDFCRKAVLDTGWTKFNERPERSIGYAGYTKYRLSLVEKVSVGQADAVDGAASQPGDYRIDVQATHCLDPENFCETDIGPAIHFLLRQVGGDWKIVSWGSNPTLKTGEVIPGTTRLKDHWQADPPDRWRILSINENIPNTSTCIGQKTSPLCAVETKIGCEALNNEDLCKTAGYDEEYIKLIARTSPDVYFDAYISYRFPVVKEVRKGDRISVKGIRAQPGNYVVEFEETRCRTILKSCFRVYGSRTTYLVKKSRNTWEVVAQHNPDDDDVRPGIQDDGDGR